jgi:hypothetical protein
MNWLTGRHRDPRKARKPLFPLLRDDLILDLVVGRLRENLLRDELIVSGDQSVLAA